MTTTIGVLTMIKAVTAFVTTDDKIHLNKEDAVRHQKMIDLITKATEFAQLHFPDNIDSVVAIVIGWEQNKPTHKVTLEELNLTIRVQNILKNENITAVEDLIKLSFMDLRRMPNMGHKSAIAIEAALAKHGLSLLEKK